MRVVDSSTQMEIGLSVIRAGLLCVHVFPVCCFANYMYAAHKGLRVQRRLFLIAGFPSKFICRSRGVGV